MSRYLTLTEAVSKVVAEHGGIRATERTLGIDKSFLSRLMRGEKTYPSEETLSKLGLRAVPRYERIKHVAGVPGTVPVNRPATIEEAQYAARIGACLPNGFMFDAFGRERVRYVRVSLDGSHLILHQSELEAWKAGEENPEQFTYTDVYLSPEEADALPEFDGF